MNIGLLFTVVVCAVCVSAQNRPPGFIPIQPIPVQQLFPPKPTKGTPKPPPTLPTKKPTLPTKAPYKPTTRKPLPPSSTLPPSVSTPTNCQYNINVPKANCNGGNSAVQQTLNTLKKQLDLSRQQHQAQDAQVQAKITQLQSQQTGYLRKISDLQNEVKNLVSAFNNLCKAPVSSTAATVTSAPTGNPGPGSLAIQQAVQAVKNDLNKAVKDFNSKIQGLDSRVQNKSLQFGQTDLQIEAQILAQGKDIARMTQQINDLKKQLQQAQSKTGTGNGNSATNADIAKLQNQIQKISADIKQYEQTQQAKINQVNTKASGLETEVKGHTNDIQGLKTRILISESKVNKLDSDVTKVHDGLANFRRTTTPKINQMEADIKDLITNSSNLKNDIDRVGKSTFNIFSVITKNKGELTGLQAQAGVLKGQISKVQTGLAQQAGTIKKVEQSVNDLSKAVPVNDLNKMNNIVLTILSNSTQTPTPQQLKDLKDSIDAIRRALTTAFPAAAGNIG